jgi:hypothetical protein
MWKNARVDVIRAVWFLRDLRRDRMTHFVKGMDRGQSTLFPECLENWICEDNPVRVIDVFVGGSIWPGFGFAGLIPRPPRTIRRCGIDMSGRRPLIKGFFAALCLIVGAVMSSAC